MPDKESSSAIRKCYGSISSRSECRDCKIQKFCKDFAASERALDVRKSNIVGIPEWIPAKTLPECPSEKLEYTRSDMQQIICFFLTMTAEEIQILQMRIAHPEITNVNIAKKLKISRKKIYEFFKNETLLVPEMKQLLYRQKTKKELK